MERPWEETSVVAFVDLLGRRWVVPVISHLWDGPLRRVELREGLDGVSDKVLTGVLRALERNGLVSRRFYEGVPPRVEYGLTPLGFSLVEPLSTIAEWYRDRIGIAGPE